MYNLTSSEIEKIYDNSSSSKVNSLKTVEHIKNEGDEIINTLRDLDFITDKYIKLSYYVEQDVNNGMFNNYRGNGENQTSKRLEMIHKCKVKLCNKYMELLNEVLD